MTNAQQDPDLSTCRHGIPERRDHHECKPCADLCREAGHEHRRGSCLWVPPAVPAAQDMGTRQWAIVAEATQPS